jgi:PadR family transcriptional regulator PadR
LGKQQDLLQGTLEMLILKSISLEPMHGYGILQRIQQLSKDRLQIQQGSLYPAVYRLEYRGLIKAEWGESENNRKAKYYRLTAEGRRQLKVETETWNRLSAGVVGVLSAEPEKS